jgi:hypothetical protein
MGAFRPPPWLLYPLSSPSAFSASRHRHHVGMAAAFGYGQASPPSDSAAACASSGGGAFSADDIPRGPDPQCAAARYGSGRR